MWIDKVLIELKPEKEEEGWRLNQTTEQRVMYVIYK